MAGKAQADKKEKVAKRVRVTGFEPMKFKDHTITQKGTGRYAVVNKKGKQVNGLEKEKILVEAKLLKGSFKKAVAATPAEAPTETPAT